MRPVNPFHDAALLILDRYRDDPRVNRHVSSDGTDIDWRAILAQPWPATERGAVEIAANLDPDGPMREVDIGFALRNSSQGAGERILEVFNRLWTHQHAGQTTIKPPSESAAESSSESSLELTEAAAGARWAAGVEVPAPATPEGSAELTTVEDLRPGVHQVPFHDGQLYDVAEMPERVDGPASEREPDLGPRIVVRLRHGDQRMTASYEPGTKVMALEVGEGR